MSQSIIAQDVAQRVTDMMFFVENKEAYQAAKIIKSEAVDPSKVVFCMIDLTNKNIIFLNRNLQDKDPFDQKPDVTSYSLMSVFYNSDKKKRSFIKLEKRQAMQTLSIADKLIKNARYGVYVPQRIGESKPHYIILSKSYENGKFFGWFRMAEIIEPKRNTKTWEFVKDVKNLAKKNS